MSQNGSALHFYDEALNKREQVTKKSCGWLKTLQIEETDARADVVLVALFRRG